MIHLSEDNIGVGELIRDKDMHERWYVIGRHIEHRLGWIIRSESTSRIIFPADFSKYYFI